MIIRYRRLSDREVRIVYALRPHGAICQRGRHEIVGEMPTFKDNNGRRTGTETIVALYRGKSAAHVVDELLVSTFDHVIPTLIDDDLPAFCFAD